MRSPAKITSVEPAEQWGDPLLRLTALGLGSICIDRVEGRYVPQVGDEIEHIPHPWQPGLVAGVRVKDSEGTWHTLT